MNHDSLNKFHGVVSFRCLIVRSQVNQNINREGERKRDRKELLERGRKREEEVRERKRGKEKSR